MKKSLFVVLVSFLMWSGVALGQQSGKQESNQQGSPMQGMMEEMMKGGKEGEHQDGMMRMMKMMDQCSAMMETSQSSEEPKKSQK